MHGSPAKHSYAWLPRKCDYRTDWRTDIQTPDKVIPMWRYASQATQKLDTWQSQEGFARTLCQYDLDLCGNEWLMIQTCATYKSLAFYISVVETNINFFKCRSKIIIEIIWSQQVSTRMAAFRGMHVSLGNIHITCSYVWLQVWLPDRQMDGQTDG